MSVDSEFQFSEQDLEQLQAGANPGNSTDLLRYFRCTAVEISNLKDETQNLRTQVFWGKVLMILLLFLGGGGLTWVGLNFSQFQRLSATEAQENTSDATPELSSLEQQIDSLKASLEEQMQDSLQAQERELEEIKLQINLVQRQIERDRSESSVTPKAAEPSGSSSRNQQPARPDADAPATPENSRREQSPATP